MKLFSIFALFIALISANSFACEPAQVQANVQEYASGGSFPPSFQATWINGTLLPGQHMKLEISTEYFYWENRWYESAIEVASLFGSNAAGKTVWIANINPEDCTVLDAKEVIGAGASGF